MEEGFLRPGGVLGVVFLTDELDCSVAGPEGYSYFTDIDNPLYWNVDPDFEEPRATSAICFNAGVTCQDADGDGVFESCDSMDTGVLHPLDRYRERLLDLVGQGKTVVMMGGLGVPRVVAHNPNPVYEPIAGGLVDLQYRSWIDAPHPVGDIDPQDWDLGTRAEHKIFELGALGPGCARVDGQGDLVGQALPPVRIRELCQGLDTIDDDGNARTRCCVESICSDELSPALRCLSGAVP